MFHYTLKQYRFLKKNLSVLLPCNPRVLLGLHGNSTEKFLLKNLYCLECNSHKQINMYLLQRKVLYNGRRAKIFFHNISLPQQHLKYFVISKNLLMALNRLLHGALHLLQPRRRYHILREMYLLLSYIFSVSSDKNDMK